jgi:uncharacterized protein (DUF433 family)
MVGGKPFAEEVTMTRDSRFTLPLYNLKPTAFHLAMPPSTLRNWAYADNLLTTLPGEGREPRLPFIGLVEAQLYVELRKAGLSYRAIASGMRVVRRELGDRMLERGVLAHDGTDIVMNLASGDPDWERARDRQGGLKDVVEIGLRPIVYTEDNLPGRLHLTAYQDTSVVADPRFAFGQPILEHSGARVEDVVSLFRGGETLAGVAAETGASTNAVESIIRTHVNAA